LRGDIERATGKKLALDEIAEGFLEIAVDNMAAAIRKISIARGHDVTRYTLACFGGAGGQHACRVADALGMERILIHPLAGVLSAYGIGLADVKSFREMSWLRPLGDDFSAPLAELEELARQDLVAQGFTPARIVLNRRARLRAPGSDTTIEVDLAAPASDARAFDALHRRRFGFVDPGEPVVDTLTVEAVAHSAQSAGFRDPAGRGRRADRNGQWDGVSARRSRPPASRSTAPR
jgi:5-oxoprolinase (ATP-hydrolysing)